MKQVKEMGIVAVCLLLLGFGICMGVAWVIDQYLLDDRKDMEKKAQEEKDTIKKA